MSIKRILPIVLLVMVFAFATTAVAAERIPIAKFGIKVPVRNLYGQVGRTYTGTVADPASVGQGNLFDTARQGEKLKVTYLGNNEVRIEKVDTGEEITINVELIRNSVAKFE